jgi:SAM-dependent methyltransferase
VTSLEYSEVGIALQIKKGINVIQGDARKLGFASDAFDAVICLDVLEHILEDHLVVDEIFRILKIGGEFLISVPEDPRLWSDHDVSVNHVKRYVKSEILGFLAARSRNLKIWSSNILVKPAIFLVRKFKSGSSLGAVHPALNSILLAISKIETVIIPQEKFSGVTLWASGEKIKDN